MSGKGSGQIPAEAKPQLLFSSPTTAFYITRKKVQSLCCLRLDSFHRATIVKERFYPGHGHMNAVLPKLTTFWGTYILPEIFGRWYSRKCEMSDEMPQAGAGICFCRMPSDGNTVKCENPQCPLVEFHLSCLAISTPLPKGWYCPHCCRPPQFKRLRKVKKTFSEIMGRAFS